MTIYVNSNEAYVIFAGNCIMTPMIVTVNFPEDDGNQQA